MPIDKGLFDDDHDLRYYSHPERGGTIFTSEDLHELTLAERHRLQRIDPDRPWLVDGLMPRQADQNPLADLRRDVYIRDRFTCQSKGCGQQFICEETLALDTFSYDGRHNVHGLTMGHVIPKSKGGPWSMENIKCQCRDCNNALGDRVWTEFI